MYIQHIYSYSKRKNIAHAQHVNTSITQYNKLHPPSYIYMWTVYQELSFFVTTLLISLLTVGKTEVDKVGCIKHML